MSADSVVVLEGTTFCLSNANGDMAPDRAHGLFFQDTRVLSGWELDVNGARLEALTAFTPEPFRAVFLARSRHPQGRDDTLLVERQRRVAGGLREDISVHNHSSEPVQCTLRLAVDADFADLFRVKEGHCGDCAVSRTAAPGRLSFEAQLGDHRRGVIVEAAGCEAADSALTCRVTVPARETYTLSVLARPVVDDVQMPSPFPLDEPIEHSEPAQRLLRWQLQTPVAEGGDEELVHTLRRCAQDLGSLRISDPAQPHRVVVAAGAPWFMALFGRDSLLSAFMALPLDEALALGTLQTLARYQGARTDVVTEEQPGRILHEVRLGLETEVALGGRRIYYGTVDATPLFVMLLGELHRWGASREDVVALLPHADRALDWIREYGDRDGDGFVEYLRSTDHGLANQGWKDSWDGVNFADGRIAQAPMALCEVQAYTYDAYVSRAHLAADFGDDEGAALWRSRAEELKARFNEQFWLPDRGYLAIALDKDKQPVDACTSNMGHCLWTGIVDEDKAAQVADRLLSEEMFTGWGVRTLASDMGAYNPVSYHNGSVWPHDSALAAAGLMRYGFVEHAQRICTGLLDAAERFGGRLPELFCGLDRGRYSQPVRYPTACSPQAWASAAPIYLLRVLMRFEPCVPHGTASLAPAFPPGFGRVKIANLHLAGRSVSVDVTPGSTEIEGLPPELTLNLEAGP